MNKRKINSRYDNPPLGRDKYGRCICNTSMNKDEPRHDNKICECECHLMTKNYLLYCDS